jgi:hypothetical protein
MKASEIVNKLKDVLLSSTEKEEETTPQVELKEEAPKANKANKEEAKPKTAKAEVRQINYSADEKLAEEIDEDVDVDVDIDEKEKTTEYATKEELSEVRAMVEAIMAKMEAKEYAKAEVPQELSAEEAPTEPLAHSPENEVSENLGARISPNQRANTTYSRVLNAISNN